MSEYDDELDCSGLNYPMPILKTKMKIDKMDSGQVLKVIATDPGVCNDMPAWASKVGHEIVNESEEGKKFLFFVRKKNMEILRSTGRSRWHITKSGTSGRGN